MPFARLLALTALISAVVQPIAAVLIEFLRLAAEVLRVLHSLK